MSNLGTQSMRHENLPRTYQTNLDAKMCSIFIFFRGSIKYLSL